MNCSLDSSHRFFTQRLAVDRSEARREVIYWILVRNTNVERTAGRQHFTRPPAEPDTGGLYSVAHVYATRYPFDRNVLSHCGFVVSMGLKGVRRDDPLA